jgi:type VI secretion system protein ImpB
MPESTQHKLDRIRPPRVQITYDVETRGSFVKMELPFVVGIMADLSGNVDDPNRAPLRERKYMEIDRDNFNDIMGSIGPAIALNGSTETLTFKNLDDFTPINVLRQVPEKFLEALTSDEKRAKMKADIDALKGILEPKPEGDAPVKPKEGDAPAKPKEGGGK